MSKTTNKFAPEVRQRAIQMVLDHERDYPSRWAAVVSIAEKIGCSPPTLHEWVKKTEVDSGKAKTRYEFGVKPSIAVTNARTAGGQFIIGMQALPGNPYDGHTLTGQIEQVERLTGITVERAYVDRGYRGHRHGGKAKVNIAHTRGITSPTIKRELRRRNAIEPIIGHAKSDGLLERNQLAGASGDAINAILAAV